MAATALRTLARRVEQRSVTRDDPCMAEAAARFDALPTPARKMAMVRAVARSRGPELTRAYGNVVMVTTGYRARASSDGRHTELLPQPCVVFVVRRKWRRGRPASAGQRLPARLLTFSGEGADGPPYAVPTDVQPLRWYGGGHARAATCVRVDDPSQVPGTLTCGVRLAGSGGGVAAQFALSAMHVLTPAPEQAEPLGGTRFSDVAATAPAVRGKSARWGGHIDAIGGTAFDVQLAAIADTAWLNAAFSLKLSATRPYVVARDVFDELAAKTPFAILAPSNHPRHLATPRPLMLAQFAAMVHDELPLAYQVRFEGDLQTVPLVHTELIVVRTALDGPLVESGDSGSPVVSWWPDGSVVLVGMLIASGDVGEERSVAYVIPAWQLFDPVNWNRLPPGVVSLTPTFTLP